MSTRGALYAARVGLVGAASNAALHEFGRNALAAAFPIVTGRSATLAELQIFGATALLESAYGTGAFVNRQTGEKIRETNNWGAVQCKSLPPCPSGCFEATDTSPFKRTAENPDGAYQACFVHPATPAEGATVFVKEVTTRRPLSWAAAQAGDIDAFSDAMHREHYYEGFGATVAERIDNHAKAVERGVRVIASALGEPVAAQRGGAEPSISDPGTLALGVAFIAGCAALGMLARRG